MRRVLPSLLSLGLLAGCAGKGGDQPAKTGGAEGSAMARTIVIHNQQEPETLNGAISSMMATVDAITPVMSALITVNDKMEYIADLAETVPTLENKGVKPEGKGMAVTYKLRKATWHDGKPVTSDDVRFTWQVYQDPAVKATSRDGYDKIKAIDTPDAQTVVVHFKEIYAPYLGLFGGIFPRHLLEADLKKQEKPGDSHFNQSAWNRAPVGSGAFKFKEWVPGDHITYEANPTYYRGKPKVETIVFKIIPDENNAYTQLQAGAIDIYQSAALTQYDQLKQMSGVVIHETPSLSYEHLDFNLANPVLADVKVRRAISMAINREEISAKIYKGLYKAAYSDQSPLNTNYYEPAVEKLSAFDPEGAKKVLDEAGWTMGADGFRTKDGKPLKLGIASTSGRKPRELTEQVMKSYLKAVGINLEINNVPGPKLFGRPDGLLYSGQYDLGLYAWVSNIDPNNIFLWNSKQHPPAGQNYTRYSNPEVDKLTEAGNKTVNTAERAKIYKRIQLLLAQDAPMMPLLVWTTLNVVNQRIEGFKPNPTSAGNLWNCHEWSIKQGS
jgi:peptide/nickel transport system substrate-binding protein